MADARAAREYLTDRSDVDPARIAYFGESLGAAVAIELAVESPPVAIILRSPFTALAGATLRRRQCVPRFRHYARSMPA